MLKSETFNFRISKKTFAVLASTVLLVACSTTPPQPEEETYTEVRFQKASFDAFKNIPSQDWAQALISFKRSCGAMKNKAMWKETCSIASVTNNEDAATFFRTNFVPWQMYKATVGKESKKEYSQDETGLMTGYYEPLLHANRSPSVKNNVPILSTPDDLIIVDLASLYPKLKGMRLRGKLEGRRLVPYDDRAGIIQRTDLNSYAIAWSDDPVGVFFLQIQGSGRLQLDDGNVIRVGYDDQNGHPYKAIGSWLVQKGYLKRNQLSMQNIKKWAKENPTRLNELLNQNPSFVFFKSRPVTNAEEGPIGAQGIPLTPEASVAVDRRHIPLGVPLVVQAEQSNPPLKFMKPVVAQDTGGAINGPLRFDFFWGFGDEAGQKAGRQKSDASAWLLLPPSVNPQNL